MKILILILLVLSGCSKPERETTTIQEYSRSTRIILHSPSFSRQTIGWHIPLIGSDRDTTHVLFLVDDGADTSNRDIRWSPLSKDFTGQGLTRDGIHGTAMAGVTAINNGVQALGVVPETPVAMLKTWKRISPSYGEDDPEAVLKAFRYILQVGKPGDVIAAEFQLGSAVQKNYTDRILKLMKQCADRNIKVFVPAGNMGVEVNNAFTTCVYPNYFVTGGADNDYRLTAVLGPWYPADFGGGSQLNSTNYGAAVRWAMPAVEIETTCYGCPDDWTASATGTSITAPMLAVLHLRGVPVPIGTFSSHGFEMTVYRLPTTLYLQQNIPYEQHPFYTAY